MHHTRRKSGQGAGAAAEVRPSRPGALSRKGREASYRRSPREREEEYGYGDDERDTFPQYCMACEKQFLPPDDSFLYCSEACREYDATTSHRPPPGNPATDYRTLLVPHDPRPIIPRASPSRPTSTCPQPTYPPAAPDAVTALRSLTVRPVSPGGAWPFGSGGGGGGYSATYDGAYGRREYGYGYGNGNGYGKYGSSAERPLPKRRPGYSGPKGAELVTPLVGL